MQKFIFVILPQSWRGLVNGTILALGRAVGDTLIALMIAGNSVATPSSVLDSARTLTAHIALIIAADFDSLEFKTIFACGILLYLMTTLAVFFHTAAGAKKWRRAMKGRVLEFSVICFSWLSGLVLMGAVFSVIGFLFVKGAGALNLALIFGDTPVVDALLLRRPVFDGLFPAIAGTFLLVVLSVSLAVPVGLSAGIYMAEYAGATMRRFFRHLF